MKEGLQQNKRDGSCRTFLPRPRKAAGGGPPPSPSPVSLIDFYGHDYIVTPNVLIPRPETEMIVDAVLNLCGKSYLPGVKANEPRLSQDCRILDVGTGSGCVAITLALELPGAKVTACDISEKALKVARENAKTLGAKVKFVKSDLMNSVKGDFDIVVANLPYVDKNWNWVDKKTLSKEPAIALYAEDGGLALIKRLIDQIAKHKVPYLILEADPCQHKRIVEYAGTNSYQLLETRGFILVFSSDSPLEWR